MTDKVIRTIPWSTKIESKSNFTDNGWGWTQGTNVIFNKVENLGSKSSTNFTTNGITWHRQAKGQSSGSCQSLFESGGFEAWESTGSSSYNAVFFFGSRVDHAGFENDSYTYDTGSSSAFVKNAIGFAAITEIGRSYSDSGGNAQGRLEKICFFYMHPTSRVRHTYQLGTKISGDQNLNSDFPNKNQKWFSYRLNDSDMSTVKSNGLLFMGFGLQFYLDHKRDAAKHDSANKLSQMRIICAEESSYLRAAKQHQLLYCIPATHQVAERNSPHSYTLD